MKRNNTGSVLQFILSLLAGLLLLSGALGFAVFGVLDLAGVGATGSQGEVALSLWMTAISLAASGLLLLPSAGFALARLLGRAPQRTDLRLPALLRPTLLIFLFPLVLLLGMAVSGRNSLAWILLPPLHVLAIGLPVLWLLYVARHGLPKGSLQRQWGVFASGLALGPGLILVLELLAAVAYLLAAAVWVATQPGLVEELRVMLAHLNSPLLSPEEVLQVFAPLLLHPLTILGALSFAALVVPLIEELVKPVGVWLLAGRGLTPAEGFAAGILSGAGYALFESLALTSGGESWAGLVIARMGTAVIHILTTGLTGWALALAWQSRRYGTLLAAYLAAVVLHGLWNGLSILSVFGALQAEQGQGPLTPALLGLGNLAPLPLALMAVGGLLVLLQMNARLRKQARAVESPSTDVKI